MKQLADFFRKEKWYLLPYFLLLVPAFLFFRHHVDSPDIFQYFCNAEKYRLYTTRQAANDFWSPLLSWVLIPLYKISGDYLLAFKLLQAVLIFFIYVRVLALLSDFVSQTPLKVIFSFTALVLLFQYGFFYASPDLLYLAILVGIHYKLAKNKFSWKQAIFLGVLGAMLYFAKGFGFVFFVCLLVAIACLRKRFHYVRLTHLLLSLCVFTLVSAPWMALISGKKGELMISSASRYNFNIMNPEVNKDILGEIQHPISEAHIQQPPDKIAVSAWNNPNDFELPQWKPTQNFAHYLKIVARNVFSLFFYYIKWNSGLILFILLAFVLIKEKKFSLPMGNDLFLLLVLCVISTTFYCAILTQKRYLWVNELFIFIALAMAAGSVWKKQKLLAVLTASAVLLFAVKDFCMSYRNGTCIDVARADAKSFLQARKPLALVSDAEMKEKGYLFTTALAFYSGNQHLGMVEPAYWNSKSIEQLNERALYYLSEGNRTISEAEFPFCRFVFYSEDLNSSLYEIKEWRKERK